MEFDIALAGEVVERQELLDGTVTLTFEAAAPDAAWTATGSLSWSIGPGEGGGEGDITLTREDGAELFGTLADADVSEVSGAEAEVEYTVRARYDIDSGSAAFDGAAGTAEASGGVSLDSVQLRIRVSLIPA